MQGRWGRPPGWVLFLLTVAALVGTVWSRTYPGGHLTYQIWIFGVLVWLGLVWLNRTTQHLRRRRKLRWPMVAAAPALVLGVVIAGNTYKPLETRWQYAHDEFDRQAQAMLAGTADVRVDSATIAGYDIAPAQVRKGAVYFYVTGAGFLNRYGFVYRPDRTRGDGTTYRSLGNDWFTFVEPLTNRPIAPAKIVHHDSRT